MRVARFRQGTLERKRYLLDYVAWLGAGEILTDLDVAVDPDAVTPGTMPFLIDGSFFTFDATAILFYASGGEDGVTYSAHFNWTTDQGQRRDDTVDFHINGRAA